jgi:hypothetical protein
MRPERIGTLHASAAGLLATCSSSLALSANLHTTGQAMASFPEAHRTPPGLGYTDQLPIPSDQVVRSDLRYQRQFRTDFRLRKGRIITWLRFLKAHHPDYRYITISPNRISALPVDGDISSSFPAVVDDAGADDPPVPGQPVSPDHPLPNSQSMVPNLATTEVDRILQEIAGRDPEPLSLPAPSIQQTPIDEASGRDRIFAMAFPTLYPTGRADFNASRLRMVRLDDYARHLLCFHDGRFGRHPRWRFFVFNLLMRRRANSSARFYVTSSRRPCWRTTPSSLRLCVRVLI